MTDDLLPIGDAHIISTTPVHNYMTMKHSGAPSHQYPSHAKVQDLKTKTHRRKDLDRLELLIYSTLHPWCFSCSMDLMASARSILILLLPLQWILKIWRRMRSLGKQWIVNQWSTHERRKIPTQGESTYHILCGHHISPPQKIQNGLRIPSSPLLWSQKNANRIIFPPKITEIFARKRETEKSIFVNMMFYSALLSYSSSAEFFALNCRFSFCE